MATFNGFNAAMIQADVVAGAAANANIAISGIATDDILLMVLHQDSGGLFLADLSDETAVTSAGNIQTSTTGTTNDKLIVVWLDVSTDET